MRRAGKRAAQQLIGRADTNRLAEQPGRARTGERLRRRRGGVPGIVILPAQRSGQVVGRGPRVADPDQGLVPDVPGRQACRHRVDRGQVGQRVEDPWYPAAHSADRRGLPGCPQQPGFGLPAARPRPHNQMAVDLRRFRLMPMEQLPGPGQPGGKPLGVCRVQRLPGMQAAVPARQVVGHGHRSLQQDGSQAQDMIDRFVPLVEQVEQQPVRSCEDHRFVGRDHSVWRPGRHGVGRGDAVLAGMSGQPAHQRQGPVSVDAADLPGELIRRWPAVAVEPPQGFLSPSRVVP